MEIQKINFDFGLKRFITTFLLYTCFSFVLNPHLDNSFSTSYMIVSILVYIGIFAILIKIKNDLVIDFLMITSMIITFPLVSYMNQEYYLSIGLCLISMMIIFFFLKNSFNFDISNKLLVVLLIIIISVYVAVIGYSCYCNYLSYGSQAFDFGLFCQMFYYMKKTGLQLVTCEQNMLSNHFSIHFSPIYYILLPFVLGKNVQCSLTYAHSIIAISGIIPLVLIMKHYNLSNKEKLLICILYIMFPAITKSSYFFIHEYVFLTPLTLWLIYSLIKANNKMIFLFTLLVLMVKEDAFIYAICIHIFFMITSRKYKRGCMYIAFGLIYTEIVIVCMKAFGKGIMISRYDNIAGKDGGVIGLLKVLITNPMFIITEMFSEKKFDFIIQVFLPLLFIPFITKEFKRYILFIPFVLIHLVTGYEGQYDLYFQYSYGSIGIIFYLFVVNYIDIKDNKSKVLICSLLSTLIIFTNLVDPFYIINDYFNSKEENDFIKKSINGIPSNASVLCSSDLLPNLSQRDEIYLIDEFNVEMRSFDYIVIYLRDKDDRAYYTIINEKENYELILLNKKLIAIFRNVESGNLE